MLERQESGSVVTDEAVEAASAVFYTERTQIAWSQIDPHCSTAVWFRKQARAALEAAAPLLGPKPLLDRDAVSEALFNKWLLLSELKTVAAPVQHCDVLADAVMELARPMPTREQIKAALVGVAPQHQIDEWPDDWRNRQADAVLALLNGS